MNYKLTRLVPTVGAGRPWTGRTEQAYAPWTSWSPSRTQYGPPGPVSFLLIQLRQLLPSPDVGRPGLAGTAAPGQARQTVSWDGRDDQALQNVCKNQCPKPLLRDPTPMPSFA
jgi:hypothetical protein